MQRSPGVARADATPVTDKKLRRAQTFIARGLTVREAAARIKVGKTTLYAALAQTASEHIEGLP